MFSPPPSSPAPEVEEAAVDAAVHVIVRSGPRGAIALAGSATAIVIGLWVAFYLFVFLPRGLLQ
jgi:hypothetical protein